jgi:uncharacterized membrane protein YozB (DUF420 family)
MTNFFLGMLSMYLLISVIATTLSMAADWRGRKNWKIHKVIMLFLFALPAVFLQAYEDEF